MEAWKDVVGYEGIYEVSSNGNIRNNKLQLLKLQAHSQGYLSVGLYKNGKGTNLLVHRLVAIAFLYNSRFPIVNHKDGNKTNNHTDNLEWCNNSHNILHARSLGLNPYNFPNKGLKHKSAVSKYHNVGYDTNRGKWKASIHYCGITYGQKRFNTEEEAALHVNFLLDLLEIYDRPRNIIK